MSDEHSQSGDVDELKRELSSRETRISERLTALQGEVSSLAPSLPHDVLKDPLVKMGGMLLAGLAVGLLFGGRRRAEAPTPADEARRRLVEDYVGLLVDEARARMQAGEPATEAFRAALAQRVPLVVIDQPKRRSSSGSWMLGVLGLVARYVMPPVIKAGMEQLLPDDALSDAGGPAADAGEATGTMPAPGDG